MAKTVGCEAFHVKLNDIENEEVKEKFYNAIHEVTGSWRKSDIIAGFINNGEFQKWLIEKSKLIPEGTVIDDIFKYNPNKSGYTNLNTFKQWIRQYNKFVNPGVSTFTRNNNIADVGYFTTATARSLALSHTADLLIEEYYKYASVDKDVKIRSAAIANALKNRVKFNIYDTFISNIVSTIRAKGLNNNVTKTISDEIKALKEDKGLLKIARNRVNELKEIKATSTNINEIQNADKELRELVRKENPSKNIEAGKLQKLEQSINYHYATIIQHGRSLIQSDPSSMELYNFGSLAYSIISDELEWFTEVFRQSKLMNLNKSFSEILNGKTIVPTESEKQNNASEDEELYNALNDLDDERSVDESTATWSDSLYKNYLQHFNGRIKTYLASKYKLVNTNKTNVVVNGVIKEDYNYDTSNELGVKTTMGADYIINNITTFADFSSIDNFIDSLERIANNISGLEGIIQIVDDLKNNREFANFFKTSFDRFVITKNMITVSDQNIQLVQSNRNAFVGFSIFNKIANTGKITINESYDYTDLSTIDNYYNNIKNLKNGVRGFAPIQREIAEFAEKYITKYFPNIDSDVIYNYIFSNPEEDVDICKEILTILKEFDNVAKRLKEDYFVENDRVRKFNKQVRKNMTAAYEEGIAYNGPSLISFNQNNINFKPYNDVVAKISNIVARSIDSDCEYNSRTAENTSSSDLIKQSYLSRFFQQLSTAINEDGTVNETRGLEILKDFFTKKGVNKYTGFNDYSTILYGIEDKEKPGTYLREGLFIKGKDDRIIINPNAKNLLQLSLFNGIKNNDDGSGSPYEKLSRTDYFLTALYAYFNGVNYNNFTDSDTISTRANILLRIPSDASNQYMIQTQRFRYDNLFNYDDVSYNSYIETNIKNDIDRLLENKPKYGASGTYSNIEYLTNVLSNNYENFLKGKQKNIIKRDNSSFLIDILRNKGGEFSLYGYKYIQTKNDGVIVPLIYDVNGNKFVVYLKGTKNDYNFKGEIDSICSLVKDEKQKQQIVYEDEFDEENKPNSTFKYKDVSPMIDSLIESNEGYIKTLGYYEGKITRQYNKNNVIFLAFVQNIKGEINQLVNALSDIFEYKDGEFVFKNSKKGLANHYHYSGDIIDENGKLTGQVFNFNKLFNVNGYNAREDLVKSILLYGENNSLIFKDGDTYKLNPNNPIFSIINGNLNPNLDSKYINDVLDRIVEKWLDNYIKEIKRESDQYSNVLAGRFSQEEINESILNQTLSYMEFDTLFEGNSKFYKDAQTFLKRDKEIQAGGVPFSGAVNLSKEIGGSLYAIEDRNGNEIEIQLQNKKEKVPYQLTQILSGKITSSNMVARNGWRAVTIYNTETRYDNAKNIYETLKKQISKEVNPEFAEKISTDIAKAFGYLESDKVKANDAQSFITIQEWVRRRWADGTLSEYGDIPYKLLNGIDLTAEDYNTIKKIQIQKNFYYDQYFDPNTGIYYPRQIKNAEFVLIPQFLEKGSSLERLYNIMNKYDIGQINTLETSKAGNTDILEYWSKNNETNENGDLIAYADEFEKNIRQGIGVQNYFYSHLYKQEDIVDHIENEENKAGIQIMKKLLDNKSTVSPKAQEAITNIQNLFSKKIKKSFDGLLERCNWTIDKDGTIIDKTGGPIKFTAFYSRFREEAQRLGMDSQFYDYITPDDNGNVKMPNWMNNVSSKLESIAQSIFNNAVIRQTLPGFHAVQLTNVGTSRKLKYKVDDNGTQVVECIIAPWNDDIKALIQAYGKKRAIEIINEKGLDKFIGYRIPTEGKQSTAIFKVVDFLDVAQGSTMIVPYEWVTQTGSDFDKDTIYGIVYTSSLTRDEETYLPQIDRYKDKEGNDSIDNQILDNMITILNDPSIQEENGNIITSTVQEEIYSRSNFDKIIENKKIYDKYLTQNKRQFSVYNPFDQYRFMQNAIDGRKLKAFSVNRDTFNSINNYAHTKLNNSSIIRVRYDASKYDKNNLKEAFENTEEDKKTNSVLVEHNTIGWTRNNRNADGYILTAYSSQTTAHILDAIKEGALFNETDFTFGSFKTLIDVGIDYGTAISFLYQPAITAINEAYFIKNSLFNKEYYNPVYQAIKELARQHNISINENSSNKAIIEQIQNNEELDNLFREYWGQSIKEASDLVLDRNKFDDRLKDNVDDKYLFVHDFGIMMFFDKLYKTTKNIENISQVCKPDSFGAKQTIHETKSILKKAKELSKSTENGLSPGETLLVDDKPLVAKLYPGINEDNININESVYPYLAAFMKYGTMSSIFINSQLFFTEGQAFDTFGDAVEASIGKRLSAEQYDSFKKYIITSVYHNIPSIANPQTITANGQIKDNTDFIKENPDFIEQEYQRVAGLKETVIDTIEIEDINNPTDEELENYLKLTPLQKVLFMQKVLKGDSGIFEYIKLNKFYASELAEKGYSPNRLSINVDGKDREELYNAFRQTFFTTNKLVKLAAVDLVKYAALVEGFQFRKGNISKVIPNDVLLAELSDFGLVNIQDANQNLISAINQNIQEFTDRFIRSNSEIISKVQIQDKSTNKNEQNEISEEELWENSKIYLTNGKSKLDSGLRRLDITEENKKLINKLFLNTESENIPIRYKQIVEKDITGKKRTVLYKIYSNLDAENNIISFDFVPLNKLDKNEYRSVSLNNNNNVHFNIDFYDYIREHGVDGMFEGSKEYRLPKYTRSVPLASNDIDTLETISHDESNKLLQAQAETIIDKITHWYNNAKKENIDKEFGLFQMNTPVVNKLLDLQNNTSVQKIDIDEHPVAVSITRYDTRALSRRYKFDHKLEGAPKLQPKFSKYVESVYSEYNPRYGLNFNPDGSLSNVFVVRILHNYSVNKELSDSITEFENNNEELASSIFSVNSSIGNTPLTTSYNSVDEIANMIAKDLQNEAVYKGNDRAKKAISLLARKGVVTTTSALVHQYSKNIYEVAAKYYKDFSDEILEKLSNFEIGGNIYSVNDSELYDQLANFPEKAAELYSLLIKARSFGSTIGPILNLDVIEGEDLTTKNSIESIKHSINSVVNNTMVQTAMDLLYNRYLAQNYSSNPLVERGYINLTDAFGDTDWFDSTFADIVHVNNKQVQVVVKLANEALNKAHFDAQDNFRDFNKWWNDIENRIGKDRMQEILDKVIDKEGKFLRPYTDEWIDDYLQIKQELNDALRDKGTYSMEYQQALLKRDKWLAENTEQIVNKDYYDKLIKIKEDVLNKAGDLYLKYLELSTKLRNDYGKYEDLNDFEKQRKRELKNQLDALLSPYNSDGTDKSPEYLRKLENIHTFLTEKRNLNEEYFDRFEREGFTDEFDKNNKILKDYENQYPLKTSDELKEEFIEYRDAYNWIKYNGQFSFSVKGWKEINKAFSALKTTDDTRKPAIVRIINKFDREERYDARGVIIGTLYSLEDCKEIRDLTDKKYHQFELDEEGNVKSGAYNEHIESVESDNSLMKEVPKMPVLTDKFYQEFFLDDDEKTAEVRKAKWKLYSKINPLLQKGFDKLGHLDANLLSEKLSEDELKELASYFTELRRLSTGSTRNIEENSEKDDKKPYYYAINNAAARRNTTTIKNTKGMKQRYLEQIFFDFDKKGNIRKDKKGKYIGNRFIYGYIQLLTKKDESGNTIYDPNVVKYIDSKKTNARNFLDNNIEYVTTEYYNIAAQKAQNDGTYDEWFEANHVYNPYKHTWEPIRIWTNMVPVAGSPLADEYSYIPTWENTEQEVKDEHKNDKFVQGEDNFRPTPKYTNSAYNNLNSDELEVLNKLRNVMSDFALSHSDRNFLKKGFAPRLYKSKTDAKWYAKQIAAVFGLQGTAYNDKGWHDKIDYAHDFIPKFTMYDILKVAGYKKLKELPKRLEFTSDAEFNTELQKVRKENEQINKDNLALDNAYLNRDWKRVFGQVILQGTEYKAKNEMKDLIYLTLDDLRTREAYSISNRFNIFGNIVKNNRLSLDDLNSYNTTPQERTAKIFENWARRYLFDEYKRPNTLGRTARALQAFTTAKFMALNVRGGFTNINTGLINMAMEAAGKDYFTTRDLTNAMREYSRHILGYINTFFNDKPVEETAAIFQWFNAVEIDQKVQAPKGNEDYDVSEIAEKGNDLLYMFMGGGEHFMQNSVLLAMINSMRVYTDYKGKKKIGTYQDYIRNIEEHSFANILNSKWNKYLNAFNQYTEAIKYNKEKAYKYETLQKDIVSDFIRSNFIDPSDRKQLAKDYISERKELKRITKNDFNKLPTVRSQMEFDRVNGYERLKQNALITNNELAELKNKAIFVNKKIHGVYDKMGAAQIEKTWWGSLLMQYKKHIYPGIMKHWRRKGYFNESRGTFEYGMRQSLIDLLSMDYRAGVNINDIFDSDVDEDSQETAVESIGSAFRFFINNIVDISINYQLLPEYQQANVRRNLGTLFGITTSLVALMLIYGLSDDDDLKNSKFVNTGIFIFDKMLTESIMYDFIPGGAFSEFSTQWKNPVAGMSTPLDLYKAWEYIFESLINPDFTPTYKSGLYKGQNKYAVLLKRNIPIYRIYQRFNNIAKNNHYYRINDSNWNIKVAKNIGNKFKKDKKIARQTPRFD